MGDNGKGNGNYYSILRSLEMGYLGVLLYSLRKPYVTQCTLYIAPEIRGIRHGRHRSGELTVQLGRNEFKASSFERHWYVSGYHMSMHHPLSEAGEGCCAVQVSRS